MLVPVKKAGAYQMRVVVRDTISQQSGTARQFIEVPDVNKGRLTISGIALAAEEPLTPAATGLAEGPVAGEDPNGTPAVRIFKPGTAIVYAYQILNARAGRDKKAQLEIQTRLFRDGRQVYEGIPSILNSEGQPDPKRLIGTGRMQLSQAPAGNYLLQVVVRDKLEQGKHAITAQSMDFEVRR